MRPYISYDFSEFENIMFFLQTEPTMKSLNALKNELNVFFTDSTCREVLYTNNTDKPFFGINVMPNITGDAAVHILQSDEPYRISEYYVELDSRLFCPSLDLNCRELVALLIREVGHIVKDAYPVEEVRKHIDMYLMKNNESLKISDSIHYREILAFGIKDTIRKAVSLAEVKGPTLIADEFTVSFGYGEELESAFDKIYRSNLNMDRELCNKMVVLMWTLRLYKDVKLRRIAALRTLRKGMSLSGSKLEHREYTNLIRRLERIDDEALLEAGALDALRDKFAATLKQIKYKGLRSLEDDLYEYNMRVRNVEDEDEALYLLRQINTRLAIMDEYVSTEKLSEAERQRWFNTMDKFSKLRDELSKKTVYRTRDFSINVAYPEIKQDNY